LDVTPVPVPVPVPVPGLRDPKVKPLVSNPDFWSPASNVGSSEPANLDGPKEDDKRDNAPFRCEVCLCAFSFAHSGILFFE